MCNNRGRGRGKIVDRSGIMDGRILDENNKGWEYSKEVINESDANEGQVDGGEINKVRERVNWSKNDVNGNEKLVEGKRDGNRT
ncbi:hypothetical protein, partial [Staphylococcus epidermidis]|uniref:hypothetical protein n=1 Tax=Staphylococcus epidermidis TaxID=1282 RepID=UPI0011A95F0F